MFRVRKQHNALDCDNINKHLEWNQKEIQKLEKCCEENNLIINVDKTESMIFHLGSLPNEDKTSNFQLHGKYVKNCDSFKYLGFIFT